MLTLKMPVAASNEKEERPGREPMKRKEIPAYPAIPSTNSTRVVTLCQIYEINRVIMSDAEVKNNVEGEAPTAEELKAAKRPAEVYFHKYMSSNIT